VYAVGGHYGGQYLASVETYDPVADAWTFVAPMPTARGDCLGVCALGGHV
jgi:hypothetical protein